MSIRKPPEMPREYREVYWRQWMMHVRKMKAPPDAVRGVCVDCGCSGVLGYDLLHRGLTRPTNLLCDKCYQ